MDCCGVACLLVAGLFTERPERRAKNLIKKEKRADPALVNVSCVCVAIDGKAASGKSTTARGVAACLGYRHFSTGLLYRAVALAVQQSRVAVENKEAVAALLVPDLLHVRLDEKGGCQLFLKKVSLSSAQLEQPELAQIAAQVSTQASVRDYLLPLQRNLAEKKGFVMDGRDIGTVVLPEAEVKIFLSAPLALRAERRLKQLQSAYTAHTRKKIMANLIARDEQDTHRHLSPLRPAKDSVYIDTSQYTQKEQIVRIVELVRLAEKRLAVASCRQFKDNLRG